MITRLSLPPDEDRRTRYRSDPTVSDLLLDLGYMWRLVLLSFQFAFWGLPFTCEWLLLPSCSADERMYQSSCTIYCFAHLFTDFDLKVALYIHVCM